MGSSRQEHGSRLPFPSPGDLPNPGIKPESPTLQADALTSEPPGKPLKYFFEPHFWGERGKHTGVGCQSLLQGIFPTQGSNPSLPHCRQTLYRLSHLGGWKSFTFLFPLCLHSSAECLTHSRLFSEIIDKSLTCCYLTQHQEHSRHEMNIDRTNE